MLCFQTILKQNNNFRCSLVVEIRSFTTLNREDFFEDDPFLSSLARPNEVLILRTGPCGDVCQNEIPPNQIYPKFHGNE